MIKKFKEFLNESQQKIDFILDKISEHGIDSISQEDKDYLDNVYNPDFVESKKDDIDDKKSFVSDHNHIPPLEFILEETKNMGDQIIHNGIVIFNDNEYYGSIFCDKDGNFNYASFDGDNDDSTAVSLYTDAEGIEQEIDQFFSDEVCPNLIKN